MKDYLYGLSCAQIQFMAVDNSHTKYLHGADKKAWEKYGNALKAQTGLESFLGGIGMPDLKPGEEYDIPVKKPSQNKAKK